jgi:hypothetical protein
MEPSAWKYNRATLFRGDINTGTWPSKLFECETVKYGLESRRTRIRERLRWRGTAAIANDRVALSSERAPHIDKAATNKDLVLGPTWGFDTKTDWPTACRS